MSTLISKCLLISIIILAPACTNLWHKQTDTSDVFWILRSEELSKLDRWTIKGRASIIQENMGWNFKIAWQQIENRYQINLTEPLASIGIVLTGNHDYMRIIINNRQRILLAIPETLLKQDINSQVLVNSVQGWVLGLPNKNQIISKIIFDTDGHITYLKQQEWKIKFLRYMWFKNNFMPAKLLIEHPAFNLKLIIQKWQHI